MSQRWSARALISTVLDPDSFQSWDEAVAVVGGDPAYAAVLAEAQARTGVDEAVLTGRGLVGGRPVAVVVSEFAFLAGSIGQGTARRIASAIRRATAERLPVLASTSSGGTRMQEGTPAFVQMMDISKAVMAHRKAGLPYLVHLRHPTTGGVFASWGSLGQITVADPGALIGFLGPKVHEVLTGSRPPEHVQTAENLASRGIIDAVVPVDHLADLITRTLTVACEPPTAHRLPRRIGPLRPDLDAWEAITATRSPGRLGVRDLLRAGGEHTIRLAGTAEGERDRSILTALTRIDGEPCVLVGQDRTQQSASAPMGPAALRQARRAMKLAEELRIPLVSVIDTPGADISAAAEEGGIAGEIARCLAALSTLTVPTVSVLLGQGCGGGALALLPADRVIATELSWLTPLPPEGASAIVHGDITHAAEMATAQHVRAIDLAANGAVHRVIPEPPDDTSAALASAVCAEIAAALADLRADQPTSLSTGLVPESV